MAVRINNDASVRRAIGASGFTNGSATLIVSAFLNTNRAGKFQTYLTAGPETTFGGGNDYYVGFDGNGSISNNVANGYNGNDQYHASQGPITGQWLQIALRYFSNGASSELKLYYDIAGVGATVSQTVDNTAFAFTADSVMAFGHAPWDPAANDEYVDGWLRWAKAFTTNLSDADVVSEAGSSSIVTASGAANVWGCWPLQYSLADTSGNGRDLTFSGTISFDPAPPSPQIRRFDVAHRPAPFRPGLIR